MKVHSKKTPQPSTAVQSTESEAACRLLPAVAACAVLCALCCRPFDPSQATNDTGAWCWVGLPKSILINGKGNYNECEDVYKRQVGARNRTQQQFRPRQLTRSTDQHTHACVHLTC